MTYIRKTEDYYAIEQNADGNTWEEVSAYEGTKQGRKEAFGDLRAYRENQPQFPVRLRRRRQKIEQVTWQVKHFVSEKAAMDWINRRGCQWQRVFVANEPFSIEWRPLKEIREPR